MLEINSSMRNCYFLHNKLWIWPRGSYFGLQVQTWLLMVDLGCIAVTFINKIFSIVYSKKKNKKVVLRYRQCRCNKLVPIFWGLLQRNFRSNKLLQRQFRCNKLVPIFLAYIATKFLKQ